MPRWLSRLFRRDKDGEKKDRQYKTTFFRMKFFGRKKPAKEAHDGV